MKNVFKRSLNPQPIIEFLKSIQDPLELKNLIDAGRIAGINIDQDRITVALSIPQGQIGLYEPIQQQLTAHLKKMMKTQNIFVVMTSTAVESIVKSSNSCLPSNQSSHQTTTSPSNLRISLPHIKSIIAIASGKGGVGKSLVAVNLALVLQKQGYKVGMVDGDIYGPSIPQMIGHTIKPTHDADKKFHPIKKFDVQWMSMGFFIDAAAPLIWRGPMIQTSFLQLIRDVAWGPLDVLVIDLPPGTGDTHLTLVQKIPLSGVIIVSTPQDLAFIDARKAMNMFKKVNVPLLGIVENMTIFECPACGQNSAIFSHGQGEIEAKKENIPYLGSLPLHIDLRQSADVGLPFVLGHPDHVITTQFNKITKKVMPFPLLKNKP